MRANTTAALILGALLVATPLAGVDETSDGSFADWGNVSRLQAGRQVTVVLYRGVAKTRKVKGAFVQSNDDGMVVRLKDGQEQMIARADVREVTARRNMRPAKWIGMVAGAAVFLVMVGGEEDLNNWGKTFFTGVGTGIGVGAGYLVGLLGRDQLIYQGAKRPRGTPPSST